MLKENLEIIIQLRKELHQHPEESYQESWTKNHLMSFLEKHTTLELHDNDKWFYAVYRTDSNENIGFRADFDAIRMDENLDIPHRSNCPGLSHKCGHDGHAAVLCGLALELERFGADKNVFLLFQHAEETGQGAKECLDFIEDHNIEEIFAFHNMSGLPLNSVNVIDGTAHYASTGMIVDLIGSPAHASEPEHGNNPAFGLSQIVIALSELASVTSFSGNVFSTVIQIDLGEEAFGISASKGKLLLTLRAEYESELNEFKDHIANLVQKIASINNLKYAYKYIDFFPETSNHQSSNDKIRALNDFNVLELNAPYRASEDFGYFLKKTKGAIFYIGNGLNYPAIHTYSYDFNDDIIETAVAVFKRLTKNN